MKRINFKRGDTFSLECTRVDSLGAAVSLTGATITSQVRVDAFVDDLTVTVIDAESGEFRLSAIAADTTLWPVCGIFCDVQFVDVETESTETFLINNVEDITRAS